MKLDIGVKDNDWYTFLRSRPELDEVNSWQPAATCARHIRDPMTGLFGKIAAWLDAGSGLGSCIMVDLKGGEVFSRNPRYGLEALSTSARP